MILQSPQANHILFANQVRFKHSPTQVKWLNKHLTGYFLANLTILFMQENNFKQLLICITNHFIITIIRS